MFQQVTFQSEVPTKQGLLTATTYGLVYNELKFAFSCYSTVFILESHKFMLCRQCVLLTCTTSDSNSYSYAMLQSHRLKNHTPLPAPENLRVTMGGSTTAQRSIVLAQVVKWARRGLWFLAPALYEFQSVIPVSKQN